MAADVSPKTVNQGAAALSRIAGRGARDGIRDVLPRRGAVRPISRTTSGTAWASSLVGVGAERRSPVRVVR